MASSTTSSSTVSVSKPSFEEFFTMPALLFSTASSTDSTAFHFFSTSSSLTTFAAPSPSSLLTGSHPYRNPTIEDSKDDVVPAPQLDGDDTEDPDHIPTPAAAASASATADDIAQLMSNLSLTKPRNGLPTGFTEAVKNAFGIEPLTPLTPPSDSD